MNARSGFGITQSCIASAQNCALLNQPAQTQTAKTERVSEKQKEDNVQRVPDLTGFVKERMKRRYGGVVSELYAGRQCSSCGERFRSTHTRKYRDHLDWHYQQNSAKKNSQARAAHRAWYCRAQSCEMCRELFDLTWEDDREQWCLKNAIRSDGKTYHPSCYEDYQNTF
ncbi:pre-mRNA cleavage complex 2 protein Pcf11-like isoform X4 [Anguilla anguilla]|nr:pre-mRNA cleavage complex 2 protein Pcf11-like isoform X4 [Anguilla anguilla]